MKTITNKDIDFLAFLGKQESQHIIPASECVDDVIARFAGDNGLRGDPMPWQKTQSCIRFRPGEVTIWGGYNGHGKSLFLGQFAGWNMQLGRRWLIASMEMQPAATMERMIRQASTASEPSDGFIRNFAKWTDDRLWIYDQQDTVQSERILGMVHYAAQEIGVHHIVIDSLMKCGFKGSRDQKSGQQVDFVDRLCWAAKSENVHIHLVHHMRKGEGTEGEYTMPGKHDFRGAGEIVDMVDNAIVVHRNKRKENQIDMGQEVDDGIPDVMIGVVKQRHFSWEGKFKFWFHKDSLQYTENEKRQTLIHETAGMATHTNRDTRFG
jgi:twinkle protein